MIEELEQPCPMTLQVQRLFDCELPDEQIDTVQAHLTECAICQEFHASFEATANTLQSLPLPGAEWRQRMTQRIIAEQANDLRFLRRLTGVAAILIAGFSAIAFTLSSSGTEQASPFTAIDQWSKYSSGSNTELASVMVQELSESNQ